MKLQLQLVWKLELDDLRLGARRAGSHAPHTARGGRVSFALACFRMLSACLSGVGMAPDTMGEGEPGRALISRTDRPRAGPQRCCQRRRSAQANPPGRCGRGRVDGGRARAYRKHSPGAATTFRSSLGNIVQNRLILEYLSLLFDHGRDSLHINLL